MKEFPPVEVTLPWAKPDGEPKTFRLLFVDQKGRAYNRSVFNMGDWKRALAAAGVIPPRERGARYLQAAREDGMHALRHAYASVLLDAGESIKALSEYLATRTRASRCGRTRICCRPARRGPARPSTTPSRRSLQEEPRAHQCPRRNQCALNVPWPPEGPFRHMTRAGSENPARYPRNPSSGPDEAVR